MSDHTVRAMVQAAVDEGYLALNSFTENMLKTADVDRDDFFRQREVRNQIAIMAELKGIRVALTEIAQALKDK